VGHVEDILLLNNFFPDCRYVPYFAKIQPDKVVRWYPDGDFLARKRKIEEKTTGQKYNGLPYYIRRAVIIMKYLTKAANY